MLRTDKVRKVSQLQQVDLAPNRVKEGSSPIEIHGEIHIIKYFEP